MPLLARLGAALERGDGIPGRRDGHGRARCPRLGQRREQPPTFRGGGRGTEGAWLQRKRLLLAWEIVLLHRPGGGDRGPIPPSHPFRKGSVCL